MVAKDQAVHINQAGKDMGERITKPIRVVIQVRVRGQAPQHEHAKRHHYDQLDYIRRLDSGHSPKIILAESDRRRPAKSLPGEGDCQNKPADREEERDPIMPRAKYGLEPKTGFDSPRRCEASVEQIKCLNVVGDDGHDRHEAEAVNLRHKLPPET